MSDHGRVRSVDRILSDGRLAGGVILGQEVNTNGYRRVVMSQGGRKRRAYVHQLVVEAFDGPVPPGREVRHLNGNRADNHRVNLQPGTRAQNTRDRQLHGTAAKKLTAALVTEIRRRYAERVWTQAELAAEYGVSKQTIGQLVTGRTWDHVAGAVAPEPGRSPARARSKAGLTDADVAAIRRRNAAGETQRALAAEYGISQAAVSCMVRGRSWAHVRDDGDTRD